MLNASRDCCAEPIECCGVRLRCGVRRDRLRLGINIVLLFAIDNGVCILILR